MSDRAMSNSSRVESALAPQNVTISFGERFQASEQFDLVFKEGMALVERTAAYLEGPGRAEAKRLKPPINVLYATESMRLTTRLLDLASWLLIRRAIKEGEMSEAEAQSKRKAVTLDQFLEFASEVVLSDKANCCGWRVSSVVLQLSRHPNIVPFIGASFEAPHFVMVCQICVCS